MIAEVLAVGTELLMGQIANTNAQYISNRLPDVGTGVYYHSVVGDNPKRLKECLEIALNRSDIIIMTGGLGPTQDDLTKETVAELLGRQLVLDQESFDTIKQFFEKINRPMVDNNKKQAYLPENCIVIQNNKGTAPGCIIESENKVIIMLPGPPKEMIPMFEDTVIPYFKQRADCKIVSKYVRIFGLGESAVEDKIIDIVDGQTNPTIASYVKEGEVVLRVTARCEEDESADKIIEPTIQGIKDRLGDSVYSTMNEDLEAVVGKLLMDNNITISIAESCTGGLVSSKLTDIPGISKVFDRAVISYSNESKNESLGVSSKTLEKYGAVSSQVAVEMAVGIRNISKTDIGVSITGIAGPGGGTTQKPVGLVYIALADKHGVQYNELRLIGDRSRIRNVASLHVFDMIRKYIIKRIS